jgi:hypothetical protein
LPNHYTVVGLSDGEGKEGRKEERKNGRKEGRTKGGK